MKSNVYMLLCLLLLASCGGSISDEQRKSLQQEMKDREIKKVQEEDIVAKTFELGKEIHRQYLSGNDSLQKTLKTDLYIIEKGDSVEKKKDWEIFEAYEYSLTNGAPLSDNVQRDGEEMIYTYPLVIEDEFAGIYVIRIPRKQLVLNL
ncbi:hypothetical protein E1176_15740 [Fulvivirga sp. RKSG066]|uniref:hypothetical protein n=1 Tax=Fulvivirga aurantia TaxID=2529383 RepID=UPI0012BC2C13|nr:hypothetical protein [Fulvivirga aurantia]MTI22484.1 hypothetical protein [Fulvivirga aurantia]